MATSRMEKLGTIFDRVTALIRSGAMKRQDKPLWYELYQAFPPKTRPSYDYLRPHVEIKPIFYPEDTIRAKFHKKMYKRMPVENLTKETTSDITRRVINLTYHIMKENESFTEDQAIEKAVNILKKEGNFTVKRPLRTLKTAAAAKSGTKTNEKHDDIEKNSGLKKDYEDSVKSIQDKQVDVSDIIKDK